MKYLGGKHKIAKDVAIYVNAIRDGRPVLDAFCGGLSSACAIGGELWCNDAHPGLIALYEQCARGDFRSCGACTREEYTAARTLPDESPRKAFVGFGCSFGAKWFGGYATDGIGRRDYAGEARRGLERKFRVLSDAHFTCASFFDIEPWNGVVLYADPPYAGTTGYDGVAPFDSAAFVRRIREWAAITPVFVSEYAFSFGCEVWAKQLASTVALGPGRVRTERLYFAGPP